jgi:hypothetical protein
MPADVVDMTRPPLPCETTTAWRGPARLWLAHLRRRLGDHYPAVCAGLRVQLRDPALRPVWRFRAWVQAGGGGLRRRERPWVTLPLYLNPRCREALRLALLRALDEDCGCEGR